MTPDQAYNPELNARVALTEVARLNGQYGTPGEQAAAAQRPANPSGYADMVNHAMTEANQLLAQAHGSEADNPAVAAATGDAPRPPSDGSPLRISTDQSSIPMLNTASANGLINGGIFGSCTTWAALHHETPWDVNGTGAVGNAGQWFALARDFGMQVTGPNQPVTGAIACFDGHVAIVENVNKDGSFVISEMNYINADWTGPGSGIADVRLIKPGVNDQNLQGFIV